jgi:hypothetical protein
VGFNPEKGFLLHKKKEDLVQGQGTPGDGRKHRGSLFPDIFEKLLF